MAADFSKPLHTQSSDDILQQLKDNIESLAKMNLGSVATAPVGSIAFVTDRFKRKKSDGTWEELPLSLNLDAISSTSIEAESIIVQDTLGGVSGGAASGNTVEISGGDITASGNINATNITTLQSDVATLKQNSAANLTLGTSAGADNNLNIVKSSGTVSINIPDASGDVRGVLTAANQTLGGVKTFASKKIQLGNSIIADDNWHLVGDGSFSILSGNHTSGTSRFSIDVSGNVGIGTISPEECLHVYGSALVKPTGLSGGLILKSGSVHARYTVSTTSNAGLIETISNHPIIIRTNDVDRFFVSSSGNVGIASSTPASRLHVHDGDVRVSNNNNTSTIVCKTQDRTKIVSGNSPNTLVLSDYGHVGIDTEFPEEHGKLSITRSTGIVAGSVAAATNLISLINTSDSDNIQLAISGWYKSLTDTTKFRQTSISFYQNKQTNTKSSIAFSTHNGSTLDEKVRITSEGDVGIGTTAPIAKLDVRGSISVNGSSTLASVSASGTLSVSGSATIPINDSESTTTYTSTITLAPSPGVYSLGRMLPQVSVLSSAGCHAAISLRGNANTNANEFYVGQGADNNGYLWARNSANVYIGTANTHRISVLSNGNVGIATTSPSVMLNVVGSDTLDSNPNVAALFQTSKNSGSEAGVVIGSKNGNQPYIATNNYTPSVGAASIPAPLIFKTANTDRIVIQSYGNVDIKKSLTVSEQIFVLGPGISFTGSTYVGNGNSMGLRWANPNIMGTVDNVTAAVLGTVSDYRLKSNFVEKHNALNIIQSLRPGEYSPIDLDGTLTETRRWGLIAHEVQCVIPSLVTGTKDAVNESGNEIYQSVDYAGIVPYLIAAIKEQQERIDSLNAKLESLLKK